MRRDLEVGPADFVLKAKLWRTGVDPLTGEFGPRRSSDPCDGNQSRAVDASPQQRFGIFRSGERWRYLLDVQEDTPEAIVGAVLRLPTALTPFHCPTIK